MFAYNILYCKKALLKVFHLSYDMTVFRKISAAYLFQDAASKGCPSCISVITWLPVHLSMLCWSFIHQYSAQFVFNLFQNKPWFLCVCNISLLKTLWEQEKLLVTSNFSFSHSVFYPFGELPAIFIKFKIVVCKLFQFGRVQKLFFGKG